MKWLLNRFRRICWRTEYLLTINNHLENRVKYLEMELFLSKGRGQRWKDDRDRLILKLKQIPSSCF